MNHPTDNYVNYIFPIDHLVTFQFLSADTGLSHRCLFCNKGLGTHYSVLGQHFIIEGSRFFCKKSRNFVEKKNKKHQIIYHPYYHI